MSRQKNQLPIWEQQRTERLTLCPSVADEYPTVERVALDTVTAPTGPVDGSPKEKLTTFLPSQKAWFFQKCTFEKSGNCSRGGFDLSDVVRRMVSQNLEYLEGELICRGKHGGETRPGNSPCLLKLRYKITVNYFGS
jgi:hypothetical protein